MYGLLESQYSTLEALNIITALLSLIGIVCVLIMMISVGVFGYKKKKITLFQSISFHKLSFYIITFIFLSDLLRIIGHLLPSPSDALPSFYTELSCRPGAFFKLFGSISTFLWMNITSYIVYKLLLYPHKFDKFYVERIKRIFHIISWPIALIVSIIPLAMQQYTVSRSDGPWCFIDTRSEKGMLIAFFCYYLWLFVAWILVILVYIAISKLLINDYKKAKRYNDDEININNHNNIITKVPTIQRLQYFPLIFIFCWFWEILSISYNKLHSNNDLFIIKVFQVTFTNLYGLFNTILFFYVIYNYNSNHVIHRNPATIGMKKKRNKRKRTKSSKNNKQYKPSNVKLTMTNENHDEHDGGVMVTETRDSKIRTVTNTHHNHHAVAKYQHVTTNDDLSGPTVSLGVGNISVMSPSSSPRRHVDVDPIVLSDIDDEDDDEDEEEEYEITDYDIKNITIGYNEDESDDLYSCDDEEGNIDILMEESAVITPKVSQTNTGDRNEDENGLLEALEHDNQENIQLRYPENDDIIQCEIDDEHDAYS